MGGSAPAEPAVPSLDTLIMWIPGEVITAYAAVVLALQPSPPEGASELLPTKTTSLVWLLIAMGFAALLTWLGGYSKSDDLDAKATKELAARTVLAAIAFAIWSLVVPASWWYSIDWVAENQGLVLIGTGLVGASFALFAEGRMRRIK
jgi:hypothetical protein